MKKIFIIVTPVLAALALAGLRAEDTGESPDFMPPGPPPSFTPPPPPSQRPAPPDAGDALFPNDQRQQRKWGKPMEGEQGDDSLKVVERFLEMPPERLAMIRTLLERIEQMTPEEREAMRERLASYRALTDERRARMMEEFRQVPVQDRLLLRKYWCTLPKDQARAEKEKLHNMPPHERPAYRDSLLEKARAAGVTLAPPTPPPDIQVPPPPELLPPPFPDGLKPPPPPPAASFEAEPME